MDLNATEPFFKPLMRRRYAVATEMLQALATAAAYLRTLALYYGPTSPGGDVASRAELADLEELLRVTIERSRPLKLWMDRNETLCKYN